MNPQNKNQKLNISLLLLTKNEEENIRKNFDWLEKCQKINEIIVVDDNSTNNTINILQKLKSKNLEIKIFKRKLDNDFSTQRNFGLSKTKNDWILWLDADEKPSQKLINFLNRFKGQKNYAYAFRRQDIFLGHTLKHGETSSLYFTRLFNKNQGKFTGKVHEIWQPTTTIIAKNFKIFHNSHKTLKSLLQKINFYTDIRAQELYQSKTKTNLFQIIFYPIGKFLQNYFLRLGFLDSTPGIIMALSMSFHSFLVRAKLWHLYQK